MAEIPYLEWLWADCGYLHVRELPGRRWAAVAPLIYTAAVITGHMGDLHSYDDRWCYRDIDAARAALDAWDGTGEPAGWHRHPATGRRVAADGTESVAG